MIRHWVEAMGDENPVYAVRRGGPGRGYDGVIAPPTMLQAWIMRACGPPLAGRGGTGRGAPRATTPNDVMMGLLDEEGLTSVVATNCEQEYDRPLVPRRPALAVRSVIESISAGSDRPGTGRFVTTRTDFVAVPEPWSRRRRRPGRAGRSRR